MHLTPRRLLATAATTLAVAALTSGLPGASATEPTEEESAASGSTAATVTIRPGALPRGDNPQVPWAFDGTLFDGSLRVDVPENAWLLGASGGDYLLFRPGNEVSRVLRVAPDGSRTLVLELPAAHQVMLAGDGSMLVRTAQRRVDGEWRTVLRTHDPATGDVLDRRRFTGIVDVLDADAGQAVLGSWTPRPRTFVWDLAADSTRLLVRQAGYIADLRADRLGTFTKDPYLDGCAVLRRLSVPGEVLSTSCEERAAAISPSGRRVATIHILSDGLGPREVSLRRDTGRRLADYRVAEWFGRIDFESNRALLLEASGREKQAVVRCEGGACERTTRTRATPTY
jgi:hypothetical protein